MEIPLNSAWRKRAVIGAAVALCVLYVLLAGRLFVGSLFDERAEIASLQRAIALDPWNADYRNHLGRYFSLVARDPGAAIAPFRAAVQLDPHAARYWFDLASAYQVLGMFPIKQKRWSTPFKPIPPRQMSLGKRRTSTSSKAMKRRRSANFALFCRTSRRWPIPPSNSAGGSTRTSTRFYATLFLRAPRPTLHF